VLRWVEGPIKDAQIALLDEPTAGLISRRRRVARNQPQPQAQECERADAGTFLFMASNPIRSIPLPATEEQNDKRRGD
jgi:hypothetical protein